MESCASPSKLIIGYDVSAQIFWLPAFPWFQKFCSNPYLGVKVSPGEKQKPPKSVMRGEFTNHFATPAACSCGWVIDENLTFGVPPPPFFFFPCYKFPFHLFRTFLMLCWMTLSVMLPLGQFT